MFIVFMALIIGPAVVGTMPSITSVTQKLAKDLPMNLAQPAGQNNNDTQNYSKTGVGLVAGQGATQIDGAAAATAGSGSSGDSGSNSNGGGGGGGGGNSGDLPTGGFGGRRFVF